MASLFERISLICKSKANALVDMFEDPAEVVDQVIVDAKKDYTKSLQASKEVFANEKKAEEDLAEYKKQLDKWNRIAEAAVDADNDEDAERALVNVTEYEDKVASQTERLKEARASADSLRDKLRNMQESIKNMEKKSADIKADMANAKAAKTTAKVSGKIGSSAFDQFDRLAEKAANERRAAEAMSEFEADPVGASDKDLEKKYSGAGSKPVSDRLAALKAKKGKISE